MLKNVLRHVRSLGFVAALFASCGDETSLYYYDAPPLPKAVDVRERTENKPQPPVTPPIRFSLTFQHCLGAIAEYENFESVCPQNKETEVCDENFTRILQANKEALESLLREEVSVDPFDLLDGEISIPTTAIAWYVYEPITPSEDLGIQGALLSRWTKMDITFGDNVEVLQRYLRGGIFEEDNFPLDHLRCIFGREEDTGNPDWKYYQVNLAYRKDGETVIDVTLSYRDLLYSTPRDHRATLIDYYAHEVFQYSPEQFDISVTAYAIQDFQQSGEERVKELLNIGSEDYWEYELFYWE